MITLYNFQLSFLGGLIDVTGSANYLHDETMTKYKEQVTLLYKGRTTAQRMPFPVKKVKTKLCEKYKHATHYVSEIYYGTNAYLKFTYTYR